MRQSASSSSSTPVRRPYLTPVRRRTTTTGGGSSSGARAMIEDSEDAEAPVVESHRILYNVYFSTWCNRRESNVGRQEGPLRLRALGRDTR